MKRCVYQKIKRLTAMGITVSNLGGLPQVAFCGMGVSSEVVVNAADYGVIPDGVALFVDT
jgi:hypothetical protein